MQFNTIHLIILNILGWSSYALADAISKHLSADYHVSQLLMSSGALAGTFLGAWILIKKGPKGFYSPQLKWHLLRAIGVTGVSFCVLNAFSRIPLADFYGVSFTTPFLILLMAAFFLKEHVGWHRWLAVTTGFLGVFVLAGPEFSSFNTGYLFAAGAALLVSLTAIIIRKIGKDEYLPLYALYPPLFIFMFNTPITFINYTPYTLADIPFFVLTAAFVVGGLLMTTYSIAKIKEMAITAPFQYVQIIWGVAFGFVLFGDIPTPRTYAGLVLIIGAGLYMIYREYRNHHPEKFKSSKENVDTVSAEEQE